MSVFFGMLLLLVAFGVRFIPIEEGYVRVRNFGSIVAIFLGLVIGVSGGIRYNDAGYCVHIRTIFGAESRKCDLGWYFSGWGASTEWPHYITISHTREPTEGSVSDQSPYPIRMADNWTGSVTETTRFGIPQDEVQFLKMARDFRSPERMIVTTLRPAVTSSLDSIANLYTMEQYWTDGKRDEFKTEFEEAIKKGRPAIDREERVVNAAESDPEVAPSDSEFVQDTAETGGKSRVRVVTVKRLDANGQEIRIPHDYLDYGVIISSAIIEQLDPDDRFEDRIQERKEAASRRIIAQEKRLEEEEQRLLAITKAEREIAERQGQARVEQIEKTTNAETQKRLALVAAEQQREEARVRQQTAAIDFERAKIEAEAKKVTADADAYQREQLLEADNALQMKVDAEIAIQKVWADAYAQRRVPQIVMGASEKDGVPVGSDSEVQQLLKLLTADTAKRLSYNRSITNSEPRQ